MQVLFRTGVLFVTAQYVLSILKVPEKSRFFLYYPHLETDLKY